MKPNTLIKFCFFIALGAFMVYSCERDPEYEPFEPRDNSGSKEEMAGTPYNLDIPSLFPEMDIPEDNPMTEEGVELGRMLFYDPILSRDSTIACATCHQQKNAFASDVKFNKGVSGFQGVRNAMSLANVGFYPTFNWHGSANTLEEQALEPVTNPLEMMESWERVENKLKRHPEYPSLFEAAFGDQEITRHLVTKAIAQFERTLISADSKFDRFLRGEVNLTSSERNGLILYTSEQADCFHCHGIPSSQVLLTDNNFHNNGLDSLGPNEFDFPDKGRGTITSNKKDNGKFKTPTLRNVTLTAPYMHDGRFATLEEVINFYSDNLQPATNVNSNIRKHLPPSDDGYFRTGGVNLTDQEKQDLINFLKTFTDSSFIKNPQYSNPFK